ncbi:MAG: radical SAM protein [Candidatus Brocadia sp.]|jgi:pyruvate formate lyase activating enzyme
MAKCLYCEKESITISEHLGVCIDCIRQDFKHVRSHIEKVHADSREKYGLPAISPKDPNGISCKVCVHECRISPIGSLSYCGLRTTKDGRLTGISPYEGNLEWYYDALPTNCVADWVCPGGTGAGYPEYSYTKGPERGYRNLSVFYNGCSFNCLFCQNWQWRIYAFKKGRVSAEELSNRVDEYTSCICYFGGDPAPQLPHSIRSSRLALQKKKGRILRICWETNGSMNPKLLDEIADISLKSGGCIKFDLKTYDEGLHQALCGVTNKRTLENFEKLSSYVKKRPIPPFLVASTLLVPGYVDEQEIKNLAQFIAALDKDIPYSLLAFYPHFYMDDLPTTSRAHAFRCLEIAKSAGLTNVRIGNVHLLGEVY